MSRSRTVTVSVDVGDVDVEVNLRDIPTDDMVHELERRRKAGTGETDDEAEGVGAYDDGDELYRIDPEELRAIRQLYLTGRELEASHRARTLIGELLGRAIC